MRRRTVARRISLQLLAGAIAAQLLVSCFGFNRTVVGVEVEDGPWGVSPSELGDTEIAFRFSNMGSKVHQPVVILTSHSPDALPIMKRTVDLANIQIIWPSEGRFSDWPPDHGTDDLFRTIDPGQIIEDAPRAFGEGNPGAGTYIVFCYLPGHYEQGEYGTFELTDVAS